MKKLIRSILVISKAFLLIGILVFGWLLINVKNLIEGKFSFGSNEVKADVPAVPSDPGSY